MQFKIYDTSDPNVYTVTTAKKIVTIGPPLDCTSETLSFVEPAGTTITVPIEPYLAVGFFIASPRHSNSACDDPNELSFSITTTDIDLTGKYSVTY